MQWLANDTVNLCEFDAIDKIRIEKLYCTVGLALEMCLRAQNNRQYRIDQWNKNNSVSKHATMSGLKYSRVLEKL